MMYKLSLTTSFYLRTFYSVNDKKTADILPYTCGWAYLCENLLYFNPLSPNIHIQILQTDLYTFT